MLSRKAKVTRSESTMPTTPERAAVGATDGFVAHALAKLRSPFVSFVASIILRILIAKHCYLYGLYRG